LSESDDHRTSLPSYGYLRLSASHTALADIAARSVVLKETFYLAQSLVAMKRLAFGGDKRTSLRSVRRSLSISRPLDLVEMTHLTNLREAFGDAQE
jgi:hypothetical protein